MTSQEHVAESLRLLNAASDFTLIDESRQIAATGACIHALLAIEKHLRNLADDSAKIAALQKIQGLIQWFFQPNV